MVFDLRRQECFHPRKIVELQEEKNALVIRCVRMKEMTSVGPEVAAEVFAK